MEKRITKEKLVYILTSFKLKCVKFNESNLYLLKVLVYVVDDLIEDRYIFN